MNEEREHVEFDTMNDLVDGTLDDPQTLRAREHLANCAMCSAEYRRVAELSAAVRRLPRSVLPPDDIWPDLNKKLESRKTLVLPGGRGAVSIHGEAQSRRSGWFTSGPFLAAAAVVLVVLSSGITTLVLRGGDQSDDHPRGQPTASRVAEVAGQSVLPVGFRQTEAEYARTIQELQLAVNAQRGRLSPETVQTVEHSLAVVDSAIAEARAALLADPADRVLVDLLAANYQRKLDLLRRTSELGSRI